MKKFLVSLLAIGMFSTTAMAFSPVENSPRTYGGYNRGVLDGILLSTSALFLTNVVADHANAVYLNADDDAAEYLMSNGQEKATPALQQAMAYERNFLGKAKIEKANSLSNTEVAYLVMKRAESL